MGVTIDAERIESLLEVVVAAANGDYDRKVPLGEHDDAFLEVELGVNYLLDELLHQRQQNDRHRDELMVRTSQQLAQQEELVQALSTPVIAVWPGVLALPLVGRIDDVRAATITTTLLDRVVAERASHVILDLTGVATIAESTMPAVLRMIRAIGLLGAACLVTGIRADVARQIVTLDAGDSRARTVARLSDALALVIAEKRAPQR